MFSNKSFETISFTSAVTTEASSTSERVQTDEVNFKDVNVQTLEHKDAQTQISSDEMEKPAIDYDKLAAFLRRVTPGVLESLDEIYDNNAIDEYESVVHKDSVPPVKQLTRFSTIEQSETKSQKKISALKWSKNGGTFAVAYSAYIHETWCNHQSLIEFYEFTRHDKILEKPIKSYETNACVTCLAYHPVEPSILAAGLYSGDVVYWNLIESDITPVQVCTHGDVVTSVTWRPKTMREPPLLISSSSDGYILFHRMIENYTDSTLDKRFKIVKEYNPAENSRPPSAGGRQERATEPGLYITCLELCLKSFENFIVGTLCGGLYKCSINATSPIQGDKTLIDPVIFEYERCDGSITCIKSSLTLDLFVTSNTYREIHIYKLNEASHIHIIPMEYMIVGLKWYIETQDLILAYGANSTIKFFHASSGIVYPDLKIQSQSSEINNVDLILKRDAIVLSDIHSNIEVWKIPKEVCLSV
ncbi:WD repeat-containing protein 34-like [Chelonus insularis]|uniref:WD repeat-containing protein 34-like n=1 Tax=Chelonus insularis TaxID=460826 RepID=UPI00158B0E9B|nr:WD repeat-containing protein 34-like [Chelonus insularis]XP_034939666.1 WD repeat-containing protein 34-like [Chelonus insularis]